MLRQQLIALSLIPPATFGFVCNWLTVFIVVRYRTLHRPFAVLTANLAAWHAISATAALFFIVPMVVFDIRLMKENSSVCGAITLLAYDITAHTHVTICFNRFVAVFLPLSYTSIFNPRSTKVLILLMTAVSTVIVVTFVTALDCQLEYDDNHWTFLITDTRKCSIFSWTIMFGKNLLFSIVDVLLHVITFCRVVRMKKAAERSSSQGYRLQESYFLKQTFGQTVFMSIELIGYILPSRSLQPDYVSFLLSTFLWCFVHAAEGVITLIYNSEIRRKLHRRKKSYRISATKIEQQQQQAVEN
ncbi:unnamed protein product [Caenorhabditis sp. 36 PRJEB53466]|nr:unnamed protein product [Caenorhabditis sp. 36 PRJEB53466]